MNFIEYFKSPGTEFSIYGRQDDKQSSLNNAQYAGEYCSVC